MAARNQRSSAVILSEVDNGVNFNPAGTPYGGVDDIDITDQYPSLIKGLVYASGDVNATSSWSTIAIHGIMIVGNTLNIKPSSSGGSVTDITYDRSYYDNPPPGFSSAPTMVISPGTWRQTVD